MSDPSSPTGVVPPPEVAVVVSDEQTEVVVDASRWADLARDVLLAEGRAGELTLTFVDADEIADLNLEHMGVSGPTDVLSFPLDALDSLDGRASPETGGVPVLLGDVVVCPSVAAAAAPMHAGTVDDELALLVVHGVLHVLGHDHHDDDETHLMRERELGHLRSFHWHGDPPAGFVQEQEGDHP